MGGFSWRGFEVAVVIITLIDFSCYQVLPAALTTTTTNRDWVSYKLQKLISHRFRGWKSKIRVPARGALGDSPLLGCKLLASPVSSCGMAERRHASFLPLLKGHGFNSWELHPLDLIASQRSHLQIPSWWELGSNIWILEGHKYLLQKRCLLSPRHYAKYFAYSISI